MKFLLTFCAALLLVVNTSRAETKWTEDYAQALKDAQAQKKMVLLDFTGSDWCPWCVKLDKDVYAQPDFIAYAEKKLVLVKVDFPQQKEQASKVKEQNAKLQSQYGVEGFPTTILLSPEGKKLGQMVGYVQGGPKGFIKALEDTAAGKKVDQ